MERPESRDTSDLPEVEDAPPSPLDRALRLASAEKLEDAIAVLRACLREGDGRLRERLTLGQLLAHQNRNAEAIDVFDDVTRQWPDQAEALEALANLLPAEGRLEDAIEVQRKLARRGPGDAAQWRRLGELQWSLAQSRNPTPPETGLVVQGATQAPMPRGPSSPPSSSARISGLLTSDGRRRELDRLRAEVALASRAVESAGEEVAATRHRNGIYETVRTWVDYENTKYLFRNRSLFARMHDDRRCAPPPTEVPEQHREGLSLGGRVALEDGYLNAAFDPGYRDIVADDDLDKFLAVADRDSGRALDSFAARSFRSPCASTDGPLDDALGKHPIRDLDVAVLEPISAYYAALCLRERARPTIVSQRGVVSGSDRVGSVTLDELQEDGRRFGAALSVFSIARVGLGAQGEPVEPDADLRVLKRIRAHLQPGGLLFLSVPIGLDRVVFNATRVYGRARLPKLLDGWRSVGHYGYSEALLDGLGFVLPIFVLEAPGGQGS